MLWTQNLTASQSSTAELTCAGFLSPQGIRHWAPRLGLGDDGGGCPQNQASCPVRRLDEVRRGDRTHKGASPDEWAREGTGTWQAMTCRIALRDVESQALPCVVLLPASLPTISSHPVRARCVREPDATLRCRGGRPGDLLCRRARLHPPPDVSFVVVVCWFRRCIR